MAGITIDKLHVATTMSKPKAVLLQTRLQADDPEWTYIVEDVGSSLATVVVHDEEGYLLGTL